MVNRKWALRARGWLSGRFLGDPGPREWGHLSIVGGRGGGSFDATVVLVALGAP